ncbi:MAG TPA: AmmeMemoRadiSam system radical SAM enzyme [Methanotrichaceae archaeon]|nr:AmmeMemoRadiSam system radical SAM enzyme [Methanotrichaceae archaeon]
MKRESILYEVLGDKEVRCNTCQRRCKISDGKMGWCMTRENEGGTLYSRIYGEVSSLSINPIEKKPVFHFYPGTKWLSLGSVGCNFRCPGCQNWSIAHWKEGPMYTQYVSPEELVSRAKTLGCKGISWTFNEPALWLEYTLDAALLARAKGLYTNYVTNGFITEEAFDRIAPFLDVYRVDIKGFSDRTYQKVAGIKGFKGILKVAEKAKKCGMHVEIVTNIIPGFNDSQAELKGIASWIKEKLGQDTPWHVTGFHPHCDLVHLQPTPISDLENAWSIGKEEGLWYVYLGNVPGHNLENTYCHICGEPLIERDIFDIIENRIKYGRCPECKAEIPGRFEET